MNVPPMGWDSGASQRGRGLASFSGTGFCIHPEGYVLTNHHVIGARAKFWPARRASVAVWSRCLPSTNDLALLRSDPSARRGDVPRGCAARLGEDGDRGRLSAGRPARVGPQVTTGNVSSLIGPGDDTRALQFTAPTQGRQ